MSSDTKQCPYCAEAIKAEAIVCRFCGYSLASKQPTLSPVAIRRKAGFLTQVGYALGILIAALVVIAIGGNMFGAPRSSIGAYITRTPRLVSTDTPVPTPTPTLTPRQLRLAAFEIPYVDLARNVEMHTGKIVHYTGEIIQAVDYGGINFYLRVSVDSAGKAVGRNVIWLNYTGKRVLEEDKVEFYAEVAGMKQYQTVMGDTVSIPELTALSLKVIE